jgi:hypothetical protein
MPSCPDFDCGHDIAVDVNLSTVRIPKHMLNKLSVADATLSPY